MGKSLTTTIIGIKAIAKNIKRELLLNGERCFLLKRAGETSRFSVVKELTKDWYIEYNDHRAQMTLSYSTIDPAFKNQIAQVSFVAYGIGATLDVYTIDPDRRDVVPPTGNNTDWKIYVTRDSKERYQIV